MPSSRKAPQMNDRYGRLMRRRGMWAGALCLVLIGVTSAPGAAPGTALRDLSVERVQGAIDRARSALYDNPGLQPNYGTVSESAFLKYMPYNVPQELRNVMGNHALICWSLLASGESYQQPRLSRRVHWVLASDQSKTYDRGMRLSMLSRLPAARWRPWVQRDAKWLISAMTDKGNFTDEWYGSKLGGYGDNANGQYGTWGLWVYERCGYELPKKTWQQVDTYWREAQLRTDGDAPAGWAILSAKAQDEGAASGLIATDRVSGPMTAGGVATLCLTERYLHGADMAKLGKRHASRQLRKGLRWLDENFALDDPAEESDPYYYYWTIQRVGTATGRRTFNGIDWYQRVTARMLDKQQPDGTWSGPKGQLLSTGFALLYLSKAFDPVAVGKLRFSTRGQGGTDDADSWNNRPHDVWNFVEHVSDEYEYDMTWHIVQPELPVTTLIETPILFMATDKGFAFSAAQIENLRAYIEAGGLLVTNPDQPGADVARSFKALGNALFPDRKLDKIDKDHDLYGLYHKVRPSVVMQTISNGIRPQWIHFFKDIGAGLQAREHKRGESFKVMSNIYLYVTGMKPQRRRLTGGYVVREAEKPTRTLAAARIVHGGTYDPEPGALRQLSNVLANDHDLDLQVRVLSPAELGKGQGLAFLTTQGDGELTAAEAELIRKWLQAGGTLWLDAAGGSKAATESARAMLALLMPDAKPVPLALDHPIISGTRLGATAANNRWVSYRPYALKSMGPVNVSRLQAVKIDDRVAIIFSSHDVTCGLAGLEHWGIYGYSAQSARRLVVNSALWVAGQEGP